jgi:type IV secretion system protein VirB6
MNSCADLVSNASLGAAPALRAVDCLANQTAAGAFSRLFGSQGALLPALTILLTLYIAVFAFSLITGRSRLGVSVLTPRMMMLGLVLTFATSWMAWQQVVWNLAVGAPDQIAGVLMGTPGSATVLFADRIDMVVGAIAELGASGASNASASDGSDGQAATAVAAAGGAFSPQGAMWLGTMLLLLGTVGVLVTARIALAVLLATGPVFVVLALFSQTRGLTAGWLRALVLMALVPLFVTLAGSLMLELVVPVVAALRGAEGSAAGAVDPRAAMALFLIACVHCALMVMMLKVAGTMAAAWNVFGLASPGETAQSSAASPQAAQAAAPAALPLEAGADGARARTAMVRAGMEHHSAPAASAASDASGRDTRHIVVNQHTGAASAIPSALPRMRARGIGSRFASARTPAPREMIR